MNGGISDQDEGLERGPARVASRTSLFLLTEVRSQDGKMLGKARVRNLSATGMMADCEQELTKGLPVIVTLRGIGDIDGQIVWASGERIGVHFARHIDPALARKPVGQGHGAGVPDHLRLHIARPGRAY